MDNVSPTRVVYLVGAGASHACVDRVKSPHGILMRDLAQPIRLRLQELVNRDYFGDANLIDLFNEVITDDTDFEHIMTFLAESPSKLHRQFANDMREAFEHVLRKRLQLIYGETGGNPVELYKVLLDMHAIEGVPEVLNGIITTNYDEYIEDAITQMCSCQVDFGFGKHRTWGELKGPPLLKLHGSFGWQDTWPIAFGDGDEPLWIPPGVQKAKQMYPFSVIWGLAREILACDVLRIIGCRLSANDWDLISLLFTTRHVGDTYRPYSVEVIDDPSRAEDLKEAFPYLEVQSLFEIDRIGDSFVAELSQGAREKWDELDEDERRGTFDGRQRSENWFALWLRLRAEAFNMDLASIDTKAGVVQRFLGE